MSEVCVCGHRMQRHGALSEGFPCRDCFGCHKFREGPGLTQPSGPRISDEDRELLAKQIESQISKTTDVWSKSDMDVGFDSGLERAAEIVRATATGLGFTTPALED